MQKICSDLHMETEDSRLWFQNAVCFWGAQACSELISVPMWFPGSDSAQLQREVLRDQVVIMKHDDDVHFKL